MFAAKYFPAHYFATRYFAESGDDIAGGYFARSYFPARYFAPMYWCLLLEEDEVVPHLFAACMLNRAHVFTPDNSGHSATGEERAHVEARNQK